MIIIITKASTETTAWSILIFGVSCGWCGLSERGAERTL